MYLMHVLMSINQAILHCKLLAKALAEQNESPFSDIKNKSIKYKIKITFSWKIKGFSKLDKNITIILEICDDLF